MGNGYVTFVIRLSKYIYVINNCSKNNKLGYHHASIKRLRNCFSVRLNLYYYYFIGNTSKHFNKVEQIKHVMLKPIIFFNLQIRYNS